MAEFEHDETKAEEPEIKDLGGGYYLVGGVKCTVGWCADANNPDHQGIGFKPVRPTSLQSVGRPEPKGSEVE